MEKNKIKRLYIMPEVWSTVTQSQVFNWIKLINNEGLSTDCISISKKRNSKKVIDEIGKSIGGSFVEVNNYTKGINDIHLIILLLKYYFKNVFKYKKIIFQTRLASLSYAFALLSWLPKAKFIFEARGAYSAERILNRDDKKEDLKFKIKGFLFEITERVMISTADIVICVSDALKNYYLEKYKISDDKFFVFPGAADSDLFFYDKNLRKNTREELNLDSKEILIVYSGSLRKKWEIPDKIFSFFKDLHIKDTRFKLLLITPDTDLANGLIKDFGFEDIVFVKKANLQDVNKYLNAADVGLLLREDIVMNNVASPTKFAEFMMAGLPVIISSGVHDFANFIINTKYGIVISSLETISNQEYKKLLESLNNERIKVASWGLQNLSKETFKEKYIKTLSKI